MGDSCKVFFYIFPRECSKEFIKGVVNALIEAGCVYHEPQNYYKSGYWTDKKGDWFYERPLSEAIQAISEDCGGAIQLWYEHIDFRVGIRPKPSIEKLGLIDLSFDSVFLRDIPEWGQKLERNVGIILELGKKLYDYLNPIYGFAEYGIGWREIPSENEIISENVMHLCWANFVPQKLVKKTGKQKLLSAPAWKVEVLNNGGILLVLAPDPLNVNEVEKKKAVMEGHLGLRKWWKQVR